MSDSQRYRIKELTARLETMMAERREAVAMARRICKEQGVPHDWPDNLHLADVIEKRIYNQLVGGDSDG